MNKTTFSKKLTKTILITLITFSLLSFLVFFGLFRWTIININQQDLQVKADNIAEGLTRIMDSRGMMGSSNQYLRFLYDSTQADVWIIDINKQILTRDPQSITYQQLPEDAKAYVEAVLNNQTTISQAFSTPLNASSITAGSLLKDKNQNLIGVVLVHAPVSNYWSNLGIPLLLLGLSLVVGLLVALFVAYRSSKLLTEPLTSMMGFINQLANKKTPIPLKENVNQEINQVNQSLNELSSLLQLSDQQQKQLDQMRKDFITSISHELNTPITILRGFIESILDGVLQDKDQIAQSMQSMHQQTLLLQQLIADLLELTRLENPAFQIKKESVELTSIIKQSVEGLYPLLNKNQIKVQLDIETPVMLQADATRLNQLFMIFLNNAIKFSKPKDTITITQSKINPAIITIVDQGIGMSKEDLKHAFDLFYKGKKATHAATGLGLAIAKGIIDRHGFEVELRNNDKHGLSVILNCSKGI